jgi:hypothetical protein
MHNYVIFSFVRKAHELVFSILLLCATGAGTEMVAQEGRSCDVVWCSSQVNVTCCTAEWHSADSVTCKIFLQP